MKVGLAGILVVAFATGFLGTRYLAYLDRSAILDRTKEDFEELDRIHRENIQQIERDAAKAQEEIRERHRIFTANIKAWRLAIKTKFRHVLIAEGAYYSPATLMAVHRDAEANKIVID